MAKYNDLDSKKWKDYTDILTDSLWIFDKRDNSGAHSGDYHGNFIPQIPNQLLKRYTKKGDWILDPFMGSGTSLIEAQRLKRNSIGIELQENVAEIAKERIESEVTSNTKHKIIVGNSKSLDISNYLKELDIKSYQFVIFHPPYWDIIHFSDNPEDLSNAASLDVFLQDFGKVIDNTTQYLDKERYCAVVIGDKYANSNVIPLGFYCMNLFMERNFILKGIIVKNFGETRGKANQQAIWRYRALNSDFFLFKHEYVLVFKKPKK